MRFLLVFLILFTVLYVSTGCENIRRQKTIVEETEAEEDAIEEEIVEIEEIDPIRLRAEEIVSSMDDRLLAAQVLISGIDGRESLPAYMSDLLTEIPAGGVMLFRFNLNTDNVTIQNLLMQINNIIKDESDIPPFIAVDHEGGTVNRFLSGVATLPAASSYWEIYLRDQTEENREAVLKQIEDESLQAGLVINSLGFNMNFAPVAEYLNSDNREFLRSRSYGPEPEFTAQAADAFIRSMEQAGVLCVIKHFPGSAGPDPHYSMSVINMDKTELDALVYPFSQLIENGARSVMAAHTLIPELDTEIASLSPVIMNNWLRGELGFDGIIISDDFIMAAAGGLSSEEAAVKSIIAGSDMILVWPGDLVRTHQAVILALEDGRLSRERLMEAVQRIIYEKLRMNLTE